MSILLRRISLFLLLCVCIVRAGEGLPEFNPAFPWINGGPYQLRHQKEKLVVLYYFSEQ